MNFPHFNQGLGSGRVLPGSHRQEKTGSWFDLPEKTGSVSDPLNKPNPDTTSLKKNRIWPKQPE